MRQNNKKKITSWGDGEYQGHNNMYVHTFSTGNLETLYVEDKEI